MLKVAITTARKDDGCALYRVRWPAEALRDQNQIELVDNFDLNLTMRDGNPPTVQGAEPLDADVLILQRPADKFLVDAIPFYQEQGVAVVVDLDDDLERLDPAHSAYPFYHTTNWKNNWRHLKRACQFADMVIVSTPALTRYGASHGRVEVIRNYMPLSYLEIEPASDGKTIGWGGSVWSHPRDLRVTRGGVADAVAELGAKFKVIGDGKGVREQLGLIEKPRLTGIVDFEDFVPEVATFDVAIAPLTQSAFNNSKSWLKVLEAGSVGVPAVASPTPEYIKLKDYLGEFLWIAVDRARNWKTAVKGQMELAQNPDARQELRQLVADDLTIDVNAYRWLASWQEAVDHRRSV